MLVPPGMRQLDWDLGFSAPEPNARSEFHLHPHYRTQRDLDATLLKVRAGNDSFPSEMFAEKLQAILEGWRSALLKSPLNTRAVENSLAREFRGVSLRAREVQPVRTGIVEVSEHKVADDPIFGHSDFLRNWELSIQQFSKLHTVDFFLTRIDAGNPQQIKTRVRYEFVGSGEGFHREQRVGNWEMEWQATPTGELAVTLWKVADETRSRSKVPVFVDITASALGANRSYSDQLLHGSDYWRSVMDGASGIDIYGHNGVSAADIDNDGWDDLYVCQPAGLPNRLFRNRGDGTFQDITETSGLGILENTACALFIDTNNNGQQDAIVVRTNGPLLFMNEGGGRFQLRPDAFRFATPPQGTFTGAAAADYDGDGWLDIYFCLYAYYQGAEQYSYPVPYYDAQNGPPNFLFRNNRDGTFADVTAQAGLHHNNTRYSFCCGWADFDGNGWPDLYVVNDFGRKNLYRNNRDGTFTDIAPEGGVEDFGAGMSVNWFDYDNDGRLDLHVANMWTAAGERIARQPGFQPDAPADVRLKYQKHAMGNSLFHNSNGTFEDATVTSGTGIGRWSWSSDSWDFDHDGFADLYVTNGMVTGPSRDDLNSFFWREVVGRSPTAASSTPDYEQGWNAINELIRADGTWSGYERNAFFTNNRNGTFTDVSGAVGLDFLEDGRSFALADFDHDGRQEVVVKNRNSPQLRMMDNVVEGLPPSISFRLRGTKSNRDAIGATIVLETASGRQTRMVQAGSGFLSQHSKELFFGLGDTRGTVRASIRWPGGLVQDFKELPHDHRISIEEGSESPKMELFRSNRASGAVNEAPEDVLPTTIETWLLAPLAAPEISLPDLLGKTVSLSKLRGRPVLLHFWVVQSEECKQDLNLLHREIPRLTARGLTIISVNFDAGEQRDLAREFASQQRFSFPILLGSDDVAAVFNILYRYIFDRHRDLSLPTSLLLDPKGEIVRIYQGPLNVESLQRDFQQVPSNRPERIAKALPFSANSNFNFSRNYLSLGSVFFQRGYYDEAGEFFADALRDDLLSAEALYGIGSVKLRQDKLAEAKQSFVGATQARASYPDTLPNAWNNLGIISTREHRMSDAVQQFQRAIEINPGYVVARVNLGNAYRELKQWDNARASLEEAVRLAASDAEANYSLGMVYAQTEDSQRAEQYLVKALQARPEYPEALNNLGILLLRTQRRDQAVARFEESIRVAPAFDQSYLNLARVYAMEGDREKARTTLLDLMKHNPEHPVAKQMLQQLQ